MDDVDRIMAIMETAFDPFYGEAWNRRQLADAMMMPNTHAQLLDEHGTIFGTGQPIGFTLSRSAADEEELLLLAVVPTMRGKNYGARLLAGLAREARSRGVTKLFLEMRADNPAQRLYLAFGLEPIGRRTDYYRNADGTRRDAITFVKRL